MELNCSTGCLAFFSDEKMFKTVTAPEMSICQNWEVLIYRRWKNDFSIPLQKLKGANIASVHAPKSTGLLFVDNEPELLEKHQEKLKKSLELASELGAELLVLHGWHFTSKRLKIPVLINKWNNSFDEISGTLKRLQVSLSLEILPPLPSVSLKELMHAIDDDLDPKIPLTIDTEFVAWGEVLMDFISGERIDRVKNIHVKDFDGKPFDQDGKRRYIRPGEGNIDFKKLFQELHLANYENLLTLETPHRRVESLMTTLNFLNSILP